MAWFPAQAPLLPEMLGSQARWQGDKTALVMDGQRRSWREFDSAVNRVANALIASGVSRGDSVVLLMSNSLEMIEGMFGALKAGAVAVPLNPSVPDSALLAMTLDCGARAVIASASLAPRFDSLRSELPAVRTWIVAQTSCTTAAATSALTAPQPASQGAAWRDFDAWRDAASAAPPAVAVGDDDLCNIIYSSGTTGLPKGIVHTHRRRLDWAYDLALALRYHSGAVTLCSLGLYSNISWVSLLCTFLVGGRVVVTKEFDATATLRIIEQQRITHTSVVPLQLRRLRESPTWETRNLGTLQSVMCCGSLLPQADKRAIIDRIGPNLIELYGLTEGVITTLAPEDSKRKLASVGKPVPGTDLRIIDVAGREAAIGASGEIVSRGRILMSGYHQRCEANSEATWQDEAGQRWLRTGDIGRLDEEGFLYIVDRAKDMIISGGQNVYPADIETVLLQHPAVAEVAVIGIPSARWGETPVAIVVPRNGAASDLRGSLQDWVNQRVGRQQRIAAVLLRADLPRNPNGKILKRELRLEYRDLPGIS